MNTTKKWTAVLLALVMALTLAACELAQKVFYHKSRGLDGILVTVGLCIIALLLCVVMKDSLTSFIQAIVTAMQNKAIGILG